MDNIHWDNRLIAIIGSRGVGKTSLCYNILSYKAGSRVALYCSLNSIYLSSNSLLELIEKFY